MNASPEDMPEKKKSEETESELLELTQYVETHPEDYEKRWALAKKLYIAWEYRLALEHLLVLKNEWTPRINVIRYLAATYYRLGRYEESLKELEAAAERWPDEIGIYEQMARVQEIAGLRVQAQATWEKILEKVPNHPIAPGAIQRLKEPPRSDVAGLRLADSDSGIDLTPGLVCPNCGAQNSDEYDQCWQCHAPLRQMRATPLATPRSKTPAPFVITLDTATKWLMVAAAILVLLGTALSINAIVSQNQIFFYQTMEDLFRHEFLHTRLILGLLSILIWPGALWAAFSLIPPHPHVTPSYVNGAGILLAGIFYIATWLPMKFLLLVVILPVMVAAALVVPIVPKTKRGLAAWVLCSVFALTMTTAGVTGLELFRTGTYFNPLRDFPLLLRYANTDEPQAESNVPRLPTDTLPIAVRLRWKTTGSAWLDRCAGPVGFQVTLINPEGTVKFELKDKTGTRIYEEITASPWQRRAQVEVQEPYEILVHGTPGGKVDVRILGFLKPEFITS